MVRSRHVSKVKYHPLLPCLLAEEISVATSTSQMQLVALYAIQQQPIGFDVGISIALPVPP